MAAPVSNLIATSGRKSLLSFALPYLLIAPTLLFVLVFTLYPTVGSAVASTFKPGRTPETPATFVALQNYADLFNSEHFLGSRFVQILFNTFSFASLTIIFSVGLAFLFALLCNRQIRARGVWRFGLFHPALLPLIGAASLWAFIFADTIGLAAVVTRGLGLVNPSWLGADTVLISVSMVNIWKQASYYTIFYLAALQALPTDIYEAADLEGATYFQKLWFFTIPLLRRTTFFIIVVAGTFAVQTVEHLSALGQGGPGDTSNLLLYFIYQVLPERRNWGYVNAMTMIMVGVLLVFTMSNLLFFEGKKQEAA
jgi:sn-glycerol 3-phosphate transport system permease protein